MTGHDDSRAEEKIIHQQVADEWTSEASMYAEIVRRQLSNKRALRHWRAEFSGILGQAPQEVLDVGCGPGFFTVLLSKLGHRVTAIDGAEGMVQCARSILAEQNAEARIYCGDVVAVPQEQDASKDIIVSRDVVWTLYDPAAAYRRWLELLRPGGQLIVYDGDYRKPSPSLRRSLWRGISEILIWVTEGKRPSWGAEDQEWPAADLPAVLSARPAMDQALLEEIGYTDIAVQPDHYRNSWTNLEFWKYGYQGRTFRIVARKPISMAEPTD